MAGVYWKGNDGFLYGKGAGFEGVKNLGRAGDTTNGSADWINGYGLEQIDNPSNTSGQVIGASTSVANNTAGSNNSAQARQQIDSINSLLGMINTQRESGLNTLNSKSNEERRRLAEQRQAAMTGFDTQATQNDQDRERGYEQVNDFASNSQNSLNRLFQSNNAGNSSVARLLAPHLIGKAAGERRLGVTRTANQNEENITNARTGTQTDFDYADQDIENQRKTQEQSFRQGLLNQESDLLGKRMAYQQDAGQATGDSQAQLNDRMAQLQALFGQFQPTYNVKAAPARSAEFNKYSVDPAQIGLNQNTPAETRFYAPQLKKKQGLV